MGYADSDHGHGILKDRRSTICLDNEKGNHTMSIGQSVSKHRFACVTAVCAIAAACGSFALGVGRSIWFDEGYTLIVESQPFARMMDLLKVDVHPPLYYLLLRMWISVFGSDVMALRAMSCVFCGLTVLMSMVLLRFMAGERHALLASPFVVFAPLMLRYGYEIRMYSLIPFLSVLGTYLLLRAMRKDGMRPDRRRSGRGSTALRRIADRRWWIAYAIVVALGMYSQYMMAFVWMTHVLWLYVALRRHGHARRFPRMLIPYALAVALYIPWIPSAVGQFASSALPPLKETMNLSELTSVFSILTTGFDAKRLTSGMTVALLAMLAVLIAGSSRLRDTAGSTVRSGMEPSAAGSVAAAEDRADSGRAARHLAFFAFVPLSLLLVFAAVREPFTAPYGFFTIRYVCPFAPFSYMFLGLLCSRIVLGTRETGAGDFCGKDTRFLRRWSAWLLSIAVLAGGSIGFAFQGNYIYEQQTTPQTARTAHTVACDADNAVVTSSEFDYIESLYYFRSCGNYHFLKDGEVSTRGGYAPLHGSPAQIRHIDDLDTERVTYLVRGGEKIPETRHYRIVGTTVNGSNKAITLERR